jgi:ATP-dependent Clp protease ATP-binding subunit ClpA
VVLKDGKLAFEIEGRERAPGAPVIEKPAEDEPELPEMAD